MKPVLTVVVAVLLLGTLTAPGGGQPPTPDPTKETEYYPLAKDTLWTYEAPGGMLITIRVAGHDEKTVGKEKVSCARLETSVNGAVVATEHVALLKDGPAGLGLYRVNVGKTAVDPPLCFLKLPPKKGEKWSVNSKVGSETVTGQFAAGEDEVTVPFKGGEKLKAVTAESKNLTANGQPMGLKYYFVPEVGVVKQEANIGMVQVELKLTKFERKEPQ